MTDRRPPKKVREAAQRARKWISDGKEGENFTDTGQTRAQQLAAGESVTDEVVRKMDQYFRRHEVDKNAPGFTRGDDSFPSPGRVAWDAWGGDAGQRWARSQVEKLGG